MKLKEFKEILKSCNYDRIKPLVRTEVRNKETLRECDYFTTILGDIVEVITVYATLDDGTQVTTILPRKILSQQDGIMSQLLQDARENTPHDFKYNRLSDIVKNAKKHGKLVLENYTIDSIETLVASNDVLKSVIVACIDTNTRVSILQFPELLSLIQTNIGDYYIIPSSVYEVMIIPTDKVDDTAKFNNLIEYVNNTTVAPNEVLGHKLLKYDNSGLSEC